MFEWDQNNLNNIRAHRIDREETEQALLNDPIPVYEQDIEGERRFVYYGETQAGRSLAVIVTERGDKIRVVTAYDLDADKSVIIWRGWRKESEANEQESDTDAKVQEREQGGGLVGHPGGTCLFEGKICAGTIEGDQDRGVEPGCDA